MDKGKASAAAKGGKKVAPKPYQRPRGGDARAVSDLMPEIGRAAFRRFGFVQSSVVSRWDEIVGARYAAVSAPEAIRFPVGKKAEGTLELVVEGAHATMMQHVVPDIIERVNRFFGYSAVAKIKMRQGVVARPASTPKPQAAPMLKPLPMELGDSLREIADPELFAVLESLAKSLAKDSE
ncbi:MAG: DciA family protein [Sphingorhabdus sp.]